MKKYTVYAQSLLEYKVEVMAENEEDAMDKADKIDGGEWEEVTEGSWDWNPVRAEEVTE
jgi:hypothetical protein